MKKERLSIALALLMSVCLLFTACGGGAGGDPVDDTPAAPVWTETTLTKETTADNLKNCFAGIKETKDKYIKIVITDTSLISFKALCETLNSGYVQEGREITLDLTGCVANTTINANSFNQQSGKTTPLLEKKSRVVSILLPGTVTSIDHDSFPEFIKSVTIPDTVAMIHEEAFDYTSYLKEIKLGESTNGGSTTYTEVNGVLYGPVWSSIGNGTKSADHAVIIPWGYAGTTVNIPADVTTIAGYRVLGNTATNPFNKTLIEDDSGMCNLTSITVDEQNQTYASKDGALYNKRKTELISVPRKKMSVSIPMSVE